MVGIDYVRGMTDLPLDHVGHAEAEHLGMRIKAKGGVHTVMASPLIRARQTAASVLRHNRNSIMYGVTKGLLPWASGQFEGAPMEVVRDEMSKYIHNPSVPFPGVSQSSGVPGESLDQYWKGRLGPHILKRVAGLKMGEKALDVTHYRDIETTRAGMKAGGLQDRSLRLDPKELSGGNKGDTPTSLYQITSGQNFLKMPKPIDVNSNDQLEPGYYQARHGATDWSKEGNGEGLGKELGKTSEGLHILRGMGIPRRAHAGQS